MNILTSIARYSFKVVHLTSIRHLYSLFYKRVEIIIILHFKADGYRHLDGKEDC